MSQERIAIEFEFRKIVEEEKFVDLHKGRKTQLSQVRKYFLVACLLTNARMCLYGNQANKYCNIKPPTLFSYFQCNEE